MRMILLIALLWAGVAVAQTNITTTAGRAYANAKVIRSEPDGLCVEYVPEPGATGMAKIKFAVLPPEIQKQYGYDPVKSAEFVAEQTRGARSFANSLPTTGEQQRRDYTNTVERRMAEGRELSQRIAEARERSIAAKEEVDRIIRLQQLEAQQKAANAAMIHATRSYP